MTDAVLAETTAIAGAGGDVIQAYVARPLGRDNVGSVVIIHHMPGFDEASKEYVRRFAVMGYAAIAPNLHYREAPGARSDDASAAVRAAGGVPDERLIGDVAGAAAYLRMLPSTNGRVGTIGHCSGGRQSLLAATALDVQAAVDCYGAFVLQPPSRESPLATTMVPIGERLAGLRCPLLGLFGEEDKNPTPDEVADLDRRLTELGKEHEFHMFPEAGHGFFAVDRPAYRPAAATEGWRLVADFFARHLGA